MCIPSFNLLSSLRHTAEIHGFVHEAAAQQKSRAQQREAEDLLFCDQVSAHFIDNDRVLLSPLETDDDYLLHVILLSTVNAPLKIISVQREDLCPPQAVDDPTNIIF